MAEPTRRAGAFARASARNPLPAGTAAVGVGLVVAGVSAYAFLSVSKRTLGEEEYAPLALLWTLVFLIGPGFFVPVEQEISRALAERRARGDGGGPVLRRAVAVAAGLLALLLVGIAIGADALLEKTFDDEPLLLAGLALAMVGAAAGHVARGTCSGLGRFGPYALFLGADGVIRLLLCVGLAVAGVDDVGPYGLAVGAAPVLAVVVAMARERHLVEAGAPASWREVTGALAALLAASVFSFTLVNGGPLAVDLVGTDAEQARAGTFLNALVIGRVPLFLFQAVQASLLPRLSSLAGAGRLEEFRLGLRRLLVVTAALGGLAAIGSFLLGPFVVDLLFGDEVDHRTVGLLGLSCAAYMVALALAQAVIALSGHRVVALAWGSGVAAFALGTAAAAEDVFLRVEVGLVAGCAVAALAMGVALAGRLRAGAQPVPGAVIEALHELPLEP